MERVAGPWPDKGDFELVKVKSMEEMLKIEIMLNHGNTLKCNTFAHLELWLESCIVLSWLCHLMSPRHSFPICKLGLGSRGWTRWYEELFQLSLTRKPQHLSDVSLLTLECFPYMSLSLLSFPQCLARLLIRLAQGDRVQGGQSQTPQMLYENAKGKHTCNHAIRISGNILSFCSPFQSMTIYVSTAFVPEPADGIVSKGFWEARRIKKENMTISAPLIGCPGNKLYRPSDSTHTVSLQLWPLSRTPDTPVHLPTQHLHLDDEQTLCITCSKRNPYFLPITKPTAPPYLPNTSISSIAQPVQEDVPLPPCPLLFTFSPQTGPIIPIFKYFSFSQSISLHFCWLRGSSSQPHCPLLGYSYLTSAFSDYLLSSNF